MHTTTKLAPSPMNKTESAWAQELQMRVRMGLLQWFAFARVKLRLGAGAWYTCDFICITSEGQVEAHEVKGNKRTTSGRNTHYSREASRVRIKAAAAQYPWIRFVVVYPGKRGGLAWETEEIKSHHSEVLCAK